MALARIISHSHEHCRELAVDLLARGYAVEIVSPDRIPDNFADLELRVDADIANALTAKVAARTGGHSSILDFVHHLSAPMGDFVRRPPKTKFESIANPAPVNFNAEPTLAAEVEIPAQDQSKSFVVPAVIEIPMVESPGIAPPPVAELQKPAPTVATPAVHLLPDAAEGPPERPTRQRSKRGITIIIHRSRPKPLTKLKKSKEAGGWFLRVAAGFGLVVALSAIPIVGIRGGDPLVPSAAADSQILVPEEANSHATPASQAPTAEAAKQPHPQVRFLEASPPAVLPRNQSSGQVSITAGKIKDLTAEAALVYRDKPATKKTSRAGRQKIRRQRQDDTVAQDTVTYLDRESLRSH